MMSNMKRYGSKKYARLRELFTKTSISDETRRKLSEHAKTQTGRKQTAEQIAKRVAKNTGQKRSKEQCENISNGNVGTVFSEERLMNMSKAKKGIPWTEERKAARKGKQIPWNKGKLGYSVLKLKGKKLSEESIRKRTETRILNNGGKY